MERHHAAAPLSRLPRLKGCQLRQVAVQGERWLAQLGWQSAAQHSGPRDRWIAWSTLQRTTRLFLVANNARFLVLPAAGSVPGLSLGRDWQALDSTPLVLAETLVDPARFRGTCYRAANWIELGPTRGWRHGASKGTAFR